MKSIALAALLSLAACAGTQTADTTAPAKDCRELSQLNAKKECPHHTDGKCDCGHHEEEKSCEGH